jgi:hypothetical protein
MLAVCASGTIVPAAHSAAAVFNSTGTTADIASESLTAVSDLHDAPMAAGDVVMLLNCSKLTHLTLGYYHTMTAPLLASLAELVQEAAEGGGQQLIQASERGGRQQQQRDADGQPHAFLSPRSAPQRPPQHTPPPLQELHLVLSTSMASSADCLRSTCCLTQLVQLSIGWQVGLGQAGVTLPLQTQVRASSWGSWGSTAGCLALPSGWPVCQAEAQWRPSGQECRAVHLVWSGVTWCGLVLGWSWAGPSALPAPADSLRHQLVQLLCCLCWRVAGGTEPAGAPDPPGIGVANQLRQPRAAGSPDR